MRLKKLKYRLNAAAKQRRLERIANRRFGFQKTQDKDIMDTKAKDIYTMRGLFTVGDILKAHKLYK